MVIGCCGSCGHRVFGDLRLQGDLGKQGVSCAPLIVVEIYGEHAVSHLRVFRTLCFHADFLGCGEYASVQTVSMPPRRK